MPRPRLHRRIRFRPNATFFKPRGIPMRQLEIITLTHEEMEVLRLCDTEQRGQEECARLMNTSQSTVQRVLSEARRKVSAALVRGAAIEILSPDE